MPAYRFEELEIQLDGIFFGCFTGKAELEPDGCGSFYVAAISLDGVRETSAPSALRSWRKQRVDAPLALKRAIPGTTPATFHEMLFDGLERAIYADSGAAKCFHEDLEDAA